MPRLQYASWISRSSHLPNSKKRRAGIVATSGHPFAFYRRLGYEVVGLLPDANGFGKPDIFMAKRITAP